MSSSEIRQKFLDFFQKRDHKIVPSSSLIPDDPSVLLTTAGMQQFKKYFTGELDPVRDFGSRNTASVQKCFRTSDIDEVGDERHLTFFEMLGNFSFGGYWKKEAIQYGYDFIVKEMGLEIDYVTVFEGESGVPADEESEKIWKSINPDITVKKFGRADNFWGPTGAEGPCGPTTEIYVNGIEIWNIVFNQFYCSPSTSSGSINSRAIRQPAESRGITINKLTPLEIQGVDTGMGLERLAMVSQGRRNVFETDLFGWAFLSTVGPEDLVRRGRIIGDHLRGSAFLIADGVSPSNKEAGYILRRLLRRSLVNAKRLSLPQESLEKRLKAIIEQYGGFYPELTKQEDKIFSEFKTEAERFNSTLEKGLREFDKKYPIERAGQLISGETAFYFHQTYGLTIDIVKDLAKERVDRVDEEGFWAAFRKHQEISRAGVLKKFGGHGLLLNTGELKAKDEAELKKVTRLHTATHLLQAALRKVLGPEVKQMGSDITVERTRFDFTFPRKLTTEEIKKIEDLVNEAIKQDLPMQYKEMPLEEAKKTGALYFFSAKGGSPPEADGPRAHASGGKEKYPERVKVYYAGKSLEDAFSKEFCGGPHVTHTGEIGEFKIAKEEAVGAGVRRVRGIVSP